MEKLNRLGWAAGLTFKSNGARIGLRVTEPGILERLPAHLPPGWEPSSSPIVDNIYSLIVGGNAAESRVRRFHMLYVGSGRLARTLELDALLETLESDLHFQVAYAARRRIFVHAGVVGWRGQAIVIPGRSRSGKSALVAALLRAGATYLSDEYAVFDSRGRVYPYPKPLSLRGVDGERPRKLLPESLGARAGAGPLPVGLVAVTEYRPGSRWRPRRLSPAEGILALLANTVLARLRPEMALETLRQVVATASLVRSARGEAVDVVDQLIGALPAHPSSRTPDAASRSAASGGAVSPSGAHRQPTTPRGTSHVTRSS